MRYGTGRQVDSKGTALKLWSSQRQVHGLSIGAAVLLSQHSQLFVDRPITESKYKWHDYIGNWHKH